MASHMEPGQRACSLDGDADRLMYYYLDHNGMFRMLDGDKIAALVAGFFGELVEASGIPKNKLDVGVVQTAYANGASTQYLSQVMQLHNFAPSTNFCSYISVCQCNASPLGSNICTMLLNIIPLEYTLKQMVMEQSFSHRTLLTP
jgi:hypothetical protein